MKRAWLILLLPVFLISCSKDDDGGPDNQQPVDTLGTGWKKIMLQSGDRGTDIFFVNNTGFVTGNNTTLAVGGNFITRSTDGGNTWQKIYNPTRIVINIAMGSSSNAIFVTSTSGAPTRLIYTNNGGNTFDSIDLADNITDAFFVSPTVAYAIGTKCWKTTNAGASWINIYDFMSTLPGNYKVLHFIDAQTGWVGGEDGMFMTTNGGTSWAPQTLPGFNFPQEFASSLFFTDINNGYVACDYRIAKTITGGASWTSVGDLNFNHHDLHFLTKDLGYITDAFKVLKTTNGGVTWSKEVHMVSGQMIELHFTDVNHGWACGPDYILKYEK